MGNKSLFTFLREQFEAVPAIEPVDLSGKVVLVIGANSGIGYETAKHFAKMGAKKVVLGCRDEGRGNQALQRMTQETNMNNFELLLVDLASFASVRAFTDRFNEAYDRLDILVANAGIMTDAYAVTTDGWEYSLQVNYLSKALLILRLLPKLYSTAATASEMNPPRVVIVTSMAHQSAVLPPTICDTPLVLERLCDTAKSSSYNALNTYRIAKLLDILLTQSLASHLSASSAVIFTCVNPGLCHSELTRRKSASNPGFRLMMSALARTAEEGARQVVHAGLITQGHPSLLSPGNTTGAKDVNEGRIPGENGVTEISGLYFGSLGTMEEPGDLVTTPKGRVFERLLWEDTLRVLSVEDSFETIIGHLTDVAVVGTRGVPRM
ncbi:hypothetical protein ONZ45_g2899 [Pleurotus djamor]|nr:hypothetical protein ONZ45_g2899 [Pleurotus djamor]